MVFGKVTSWAERLFSPDKVVQRQFGLFLALLREDRRSLKLITRLEEIHQRPIPTDWSRIALLVHALSAATTRLISRLQEMRPQAYSELSESHSRITSELKQFFPQLECTSSPPYSIPLLKCLQYPDLVGGKALTLARIQHETDIPVPTGFVVTTNAFHAFVEENGLRPHILRQLRRLNLHKPEHLAEIAAQLHHTIMAGEVPEKVLREIATAITATGLSSTSSWAVRSSATGEDDGETSFAGQYTTVLNVSTDDLAGAFKTVLASKYSATALTYRLYSGLDDSMTPMAALILPMIDAQSSGVMYSLDPLDACRGECLVITAIPGLGTRLVDGSVIPDLFLVSRQNPNHFWAKRPARKSSGSDGKQHLRSTTRSSLCLDDKAASTLARWGLQLEDLAGTPQDVEWARNSGGDLFILQSRPIQGSRTVFSETEPREETEQGPPPVSPSAVLLEMGTAAGAGIATGPIYQLADTNDLGKVPPNCILVTPAIPPSLVPLVYKVGAVLAEQGSKASHFASVAREFGLPLIVGLGDLSASVTNGMAVTVDAYRGVVYEGDVPELLAWKEKQQSKPPSPFQLKLVPLLKKISPLNLTDPGSTEFHPAKCLSYHDLVRYVHEKGTEEMFSLVDAKGGGLRRAKVLESEIPIVMQVLDLGGGLHRDAAARKSVTPADFRSIPMQAVWNGLTDREVHWAQGLLHLDWERFDQVSGGIFSLKSSSLLASYALIAHTYAHLLLRFGYHFAVVDTLCGERPEENYIQFRFKGGGGTSEKKAWRLIMLDQVLRHFDFQVDREDDMLEAKIMRLDSGSSRLRLQLIGYLLGRTPLLDMALQNESDALAMADQFIQKWQP
jgi:pyruvate, water dikinase